MQKHAAFRRLRPAFLLLCALAPMIAVGISVPVIDPTRPGLRMLLYFAGCGTSFLLLGLWEMRFVRVVSPRLVPTRGALCALLVLLGITALALARLGAMSTIEATVLALVGVVSGALYLWLRA